MDLLAQFGRVPRTVAEVIGSTPIRVPGCSGSLRAQSLIGNSSISYPYLWSLQLLQLLKRKPVFMPFERIAKALAKNLRASFPK